MNFSAFVCLVLSWRGTRRIPHTSSASTNPARSFSASPSLAFSPRPSRQRSLTRARLARTPSTCLSAGPRASAATFGCVTTGWSACVRRGARARLGGSISAREGAWTMRRLAARETAIEGRLSAMRRVFSVVRGLLEVMASTRECSCVGSIHMDSPSELARKIPPVCLYITT